MTSSTDIPPVTPPSLPASGASRDASARAVRRPSSGDSPTEAAALSPATSQPEGPISPANLRIEEVEVDEERDLLWGHSAKGYYLSVVMHIAAYCLAAALFYLFSEQLLPDELVTSVQARLAEEDVVDDRAFEEAPEVQLMTEAAPRSIQEISSNLEIVDNGTIETLNRDLFSSAKSDDDGDSEPSQMLFKMPEKGLAVTKGSFTAWTDPPNPAVGEWYRIIIEVRIPKKIRVYHLSDLQGTVVGTDGFKRRIPFDTNWRTSSLFVDEENKLKMIESRSRVKPRDNKIQLVIRIPPASKNLVKDTIELKSRRLREKQELELVFGK